MTMVQGNKHSGRSMQEALREHRGGIHTRGLAREVPLEGAPEELRCEGAA